MAHNTDAPIPIRSAFAKKFESTDEADKLITKMQLCCITVEYQINNSRDHLRLRDNSKESW